MSHFRDKDLDDPRADTRLQQVMQGKMSSIEYLLFFRSDVPKPWLMMPLRDMIPLPFPITSAETMTNEDRRRVCKWTTRLGNTFKARVFCRIEKGN